MLRDFFSSEGIDAFGELWRSDILFSDEKRLARVEREMGRVQSAVLFLMPYYASEEVTNLSYYARPEDYHCFVREMAPRLKVYLTERGYTEPFAICADTSPLSERRCAARAGLGVLGDNGLLIHPRYGSYVFIGAVLLSRPIAPQEAREEKECLHCARCAAACPTGCLDSGEREHCLSYLTQKKKRSEEEQALVKKAMFRWGCDLCQLCCPLNEKAENTPIPFFLNNRLERLDSSSATLPEEEFSRRAFSWRGRDLIIENLKGQL